MNAPKPGHTLARHIKLGAALLGVLFLVLVPTRVAAQGQPENVDPRVLFDPKNRDATRIPAIINRIDSDERAIDAQISEIERNKAELASLISQIRNLSVPTRIESVTVPAWLSSLSSAGSTSDQLDVLKDNVSALQAFFQKMTTREQSLSRIRELLPIQRIPTQASSFRSELNARMARRIDVIGPRCASNLFPEISTFLGKDKNDASRFSDDSQVVSIVLTCLDAATKTVDLGEIRASVVSELQIVDTELDTRIKSLKATLGALLDNKTKWQNQLRRATEISNSLIDWTIPLLAISVVALLGIPALYRIEIQQIVLSNGIILEVFTVFLLITTVLLLGIADRVQSEALGTLLGGISGYVLGRSTQRPPGREAQDKKDETFHDPAKKNPVVETKDKESSGPAQPGQPQPA